MQAFILTTLLSLLLSQAAHAQPAGDVNAERREMLRQKMQERLKEVDTDGDGAVSQDEYMAKAAKRFENVDSNSDGKITAEERRQFIKQKRQQQ